MYKYSKSTGGFYVVEIHGDNIPSDAVDVSKEEHQSLMEGQAAGKRISSDKKGNPILADQLPPTAEEKKVFAQWYLDSTDWYVMRKLETGDEIPEEVSRLRAQSRAELAG